MRLNLKKIFISLLLSGQFMNSNVIIWDIGETLLKTNPFRAYFSTGPINNISYMFSFFKTNKIDINGYKNHIKDFFIDTLTLIPSPCKPTNLDALGINGKVLPAIQRDYLLGNLSSKQSLEIINKWIYENKNHFKDEKQKYLFIKLSELYFDPIVNIANQQYTPSIELLKKCYEAKDENGKRKNVCLILSNWPKDSLFGLHNNFKEIFQYTDFQIFSCNEKLLKPSEGLFRKCLNFKKPNHQNVIFIDDQLENLKMGKKFGMICTHPKDAEAILKKYLII